jgi:drug/metabolite transporter (DMT)-like permease
MGVALIGGIVVGVSDAGDSAARNPFLGDVLALGGAWMAASYVTIGRRLRSKISLGSYTFIVYSMAAVALVAIMFAARQTPWGYPALAYLWFILLALIPQLLGHSIFNWALRYLSAAFVSTTLLGEPIGATILAYFLLHESPSVVKVFGAILILAGIYVLSVRPFFDEISEMR